MRNCAILGGWALVFLLSGCGGDGGPSGFVQSTPPPVPTNSSLTNLQASQSFVNDAAYETATFDLVTSTGVTGTARNATLTVSYDAATRGYTVTANGRSQTFGTTDIQSGSDQYLTNYRKSDAAGRDYLSLMASPSLTSTGTTQYVGLGFWQHNQVSGSNQNTEYATFTYGLPTAASAVPKMGTAAFTIDVFGLTSIPGQQPRSFDGRGNFSIDFGAGVFSTHTYLTETELVSGAGTSGGGIELTGAGHLAASDGSFSGNALYGGANGQAAGLLNGRFYGPNGQELGASFSGTNSNGMSVAGSFIGQRDPSVTPDNLTLTNMTQSQLFYVQFGNNLVSQLNWQNSETFTLSPPTSDMSGGQFTINDKIGSSDPNFITYHKTFNSLYSGSQDVTLQLYRPGSGNRELALTYASFGKWSVLIPQGTTTKQTDLYFTYGLGTPTQLLSGKTGSGHYEGVVYGNASGPGGPSSVKGSSRFDVNFGSQSYSGALSMAGAAAGAIDFGSFDFAGRLSTTTADSEAVLTRGGQSVGRLVTRFYGPDGEEIAGNFALSVPAGATGAGTSISGIAAAKRQ